MNIRTIFQNENRDWRSGWRIVAMVVLRGHAAVVAYLREARCRRDLAEGVRALFAKRALTLAV
jgi:hypothetical protein